MTLRLVHSQPANPRVTWSDLDDDEREAANTLAERFGLGVDDMLLALSTKAGCDSSPESGVARMPGWVASIVRECAIRFSAELRDVLGRTTVHQAVKARKLAVYLVRTDETRPGWDLVAEWFDRSRSNAMRLGKHGESMVARRFPELWHGHVIGDRRAG